MPNEIVESCLQCGSCEPECPHGAISLDDGNYVIDAAKCDECADTGESRCIAACPVEGAIVKA